MLRTVIRSYSDLLTILSLNNFDNQSLKSALSLLKTDSLSEVHCTSFRSKSDSYSFGEAIAVVLDKKTFHISNLTLKAFVFHKGSMKKE